MPLGGGLKPAPAGRLRRVGPAITSAASHATWSTLANTGRIAAAHTTILTQGEVLKLGIIRENYEPLAAVPVAKKNQKARSKSGL
jgi:hypothetical protein